MARTKPVAPEATIHIPKLDLKTLRVKIVGDSPLIMHKWSDEAKQSILGRQMQKAKTAKAPRDPQKEYEASIYRDPTGKIAMPTVAFKRALVDAASFAQDLTKVSLRGAVHMVGEWAGIIGEPELREDCVRIGMGTGDLRYRAQFKAWSTELILQVNAGVLSEEQVIAMLDLAGFAVGVADWRPQKSGSYGRFHVKREAA